MNTAALTSYRFIAAIIVVIFHYGRNAGFTSIAPGLLTAGPQMVTFFFALSGFVMAIAYGNAREFSSQKYWVNRFARIAPVYFIALLMSLYFYYGGDSQNNLTGAVLSATFLQSWIPPYPTTLNTPAWSLSVEAFFYLSFPLIIGLIRQYKPTPLNLMLIGLGVWAATQLVLVTLLNSSFYTGNPSPSHDIINYFPLSHLCSFLLGICGGYWVLNTKSNSRSSTTQYLQLGIALVACYWVLENNARISNLNGFKLPLDSSLLAPLFLFLICSTVQCKSAVMDLLSARPFLILGEASYAIYILQNPIHYIFNRKLKPLLGMTPDMFFLCYAASLIVISLLAFLLVEKPAKEFLRKALTLMLTTDRKYE